MLTPAKLSELWEHHPAVDEVISIERNDTLVCVAKRVRRGQFDTALLFPNSPRSALEVWLAGVPERIGFARPWRTWALTRPVPCPSGVATSRRSAAEVQRLIREQPAKPRDSFPQTGHQVYDYLRLAQTLGADGRPVPPVINVTDEEVRAIRKRFGARESDLLIGLNPGAEYGPAKRWPEERFIEAARLVMAETNCHWWIFGGPGRCRLAERIAMALPKGGAQSLAGKTTLRELCAALKACTVVLTNDTGPNARGGGGRHSGRGALWQHFAGVDWPGMARGRGPQIVHGQAPCAPCFRRTCPIDFRCMTSIAVSDVVAAVLELAAKMRT